MKNLIYGLIDPRTLLVRYIGKTVNGLARPNEHRRIVHKERTYKANWIRSLQREGLDYEIVILEETTDLETAERWWIAFGRACGWPLTNLTDGGDGASGHIPSAKTRALWSAARKGKSVGLGKPKSSAHRARLAEALTGKPWSDEQRAAHLAGVRAGKRPRGFTGRKHSEETRAKMSAAHKKRKFNRVRLMLYNLLA